jgi:hypothetical protein
MSESESTDLEPRPLAGEVFSQSDTHRRVSEYLRRYGAADLRKKVAAHHRNVSANQAKLVSVARKMLTEAYLTGCVLLALQQKAKGSFLTADHKLVAGTEVSKSTAYRYMALAEGWHLLGNAETVMSITAALRHIEDEKHRPADFSDLDEDLAHDDEGVIIPQRPTKTGRPRAALADKLRRRVTMLVTDARSQIYDDPRAMQAALVDGISELQRLVEELDEYLAEP